MAVRGNGFCMYNNVHVCMNERMKLMAQHVLYNLDMQILPRI